MKKHNTSPSSRGTNETEHKARGAADENAYRDRVREAASKVREDNREILNRLATK